MWKDNIYAAIINKSEIVDVLKTNVTDIFAHYFNSPVVSVFGGHLYQMKYVLDEIVKKYPNGLKTYREKKVENDDEDYFLRPNNLREVCIESHLMPLFMQYLRDLKCEAIEIMVDNVPANFLKDVNVTLDDLSELNDEDIGKFKELFLNQHRVSPVHDSARFKESGKNFDNLLDFTVDILAKRVPVDGVNVKVEQIHQKIVLCEMPEGMYNKDTK